MDGIVLLYNHYDEGDNINTSISFSGRQKLLHLLEQDPSMVKPSTASRLAMEILLSSNCSISLRIIGKALVTFSKS